MTFYEQVGFVTLIVAILALVVMVLIPSIRMVWHLTVEHAAATVATLTVAGVVLLIIWYEVGGTVTLAGTVIGLCLTLPFEPVLRRWVRRDLSIFLEEGSYLDEEN